LTVASAFVVIADLDEEFGSSLEKELSGYVDAIASGGLFSLMMPRRSVKFIKTNVTSWADQLAVFKTAVSSSPSGRVDIVIANAGISGSDTVFQNDGMLL
jgi:NAD(P)-dependent dehydrogenase (short-subunit alcohol dehydrogenase family)